MRRRTWFRVHSWLGVMTGMLVFVICWSGAFAVLSHEIDWLLNPMLRVTAHAEQAAWDDLHAAVLRAYPQAENLSLHAPLYSRFASVAEFDLPAQQYVRAYLNPYTAELLGHTSFFNVQRFFRSFHMNLFNLGLGSPAGYYFVTAFSFTLLGSLITSLVFYKRWWRGFFTLKRRRGARVFWSNMHKLAGVWGLWFVLVIALTGVWYLAEFFDVDLGYPDVTPTGQVREPSARLPLDVLVQQARTGWPELDIRTIYLPAEWNGNTLLLQGEGDAVLVRDRANQLFLDALSGDVLARQTAQSIGWPARWVDTADPLHFGNFAGLISKFLWFAFGLLLSGLCLSGAYLHGKRLQREAGGRQRARWRDTDTAIATTVLVLIASACGAWTEIKFYGPTVDGIQYWPDVVWPVSAFILGWIVATLAILAWWVRLLRRSIEGITAAKPDSVSRSP